VTCRVHAYFHAHASWAVFVTTDRFATCEIDASASPRKPYVWMRDRSENWASLDVAKRVASSGRSAFYAVFVSARRRRVGEREGYTNSGAVVLDLEELHAAVLDGDADARGACVERVLEQLLERGGRAVNDLRVFTSACERDSQEGWQLTSPAAMRLMSASSNRRIGAGPGGGDGERAGPASMGIYDRNFWPGRLIDPRRNCVCVRLDSLCTQG
jgi:hypothetical protein